ncbi:hypothetical protein [uncultured Arthrobacter sp.]|uniref:hypothetical protein n=1 Tax=uncultured Arthrobacter sp. TaxID=114050 RepID=UPI00262EC723|nr:hypothetical protein [uncultured Arthrobacter sp.]
MSPTQPNTSPRDQDLALLAAGYETGWWDEHGRPAPWPEDFWLADGTINPHWQQSGSHPEEETRPDPSENHNF